MCADSDNGGSGGRNFDGVLRHELGVLDRLRHPKGSVKVPVDGASVYRRAYDSKLAGLAFSGGGIRSATFNLGVIQALARYRLLSKFDYLSTVSGGGYIGSWLSAFLHRAAETGQGGQKTVDERTTARCEALMKPHPCKTPQASGQRWDDTKDLTCDMRSGFGEPDNCGFPPPEHAAVRFLRRYTNYLTPRTGISGDTLSLTSLFLRNLVLIQLALALLIAVAMLTVYVIAWWATGYIQQTSVAALPGVPLMLVGAVLALLIAMCASAGLVGLSTEHYGPDKKGSVRLRIVLLMVAILVTWTGVFATRGADQLALALLGTVVILGCGRLCGFGATSKWPDPHAALTVNLLVVLPATLGAVLFTVGVSRPETRGLLQPWWPWITHPAGAYAAFSVVGFYWKRLLTWAGDMLRWAVRRFLLTPAERRSQNRQTAAASGRRASSGRPQSLRFLHVLAASAVAGAVLGALLWLATDILAPTEKYSNTEALLVLIVGPPAFLLAFSLAVTVHMFLARRTLAAGHREWWARLGGFVLFVTLAWTALFGITLLSKPFIHWLGAGGYALLVSWATASGVGAWLAKGAETSIGGGTLKIRQFVTGLAPWLFVLGLVALVAYLLQTAMLTWAVADEFVWGRYGPGLAAITEHALDAVVTPVWPNMKLLAAVVVGAFLLILWLDVNLFSLHSIYKNRLTRAYLGAYSAESPRLGGTGGHADGRNEHPFTGFSQNDDLPLSSLADQRPIPILNATVNMTGGDELAWQTRRAAAFSLTPYDCGYEAKTTDGKKLGRYRPTRQFAGDISLGTAFAVSGAAASPNMGYHTSPSVAALLTAFNLRLGYWAGNVEHDGAWRVASPGSFLRPFIAELTGTASGKAKWINLTDGGHFDNLGIYELVRRRCRLIVATDIGRDPRRELEDLANAVRKCWTDFGVHIQFESSLDELQLTDPEKQVSQKSVLTGIVEYPVDHSNRIKEYGVLVYLKSTLTTEIADRYPDIRQYADTHASFPHESTIDQFFDENQFEAYRHLGFRIAQAVCRRIGKYVENLDDPERPMVDRINDSRAGPKSTTRSRSVALEQTLQTVQLFIEP